jgi:hypothetical protein
MMAGRVHSLVEGPAGWVLFLDRARVGGIYGTKEAAFEAVMVALSELAMAFRSTCQATPGCAARTKSMCVFQMTSPLRPSGTRRNSSRLSDADLILRP